MEKKRPKLTTIQDKKSEEKRFHGGYVPPPLKRQLEPTEKKGYAPPVLKPPSRPAQNPPRKPGGGGNKPSGGKTG